MNTKVLVKSLAVFAVVILGSPAAHAATITVQNLGSILNDSVSFPATKTPGASKMFEDFFEFTLPTAEYVTASMSISGPTSDQIPAGKGQLTLSTWTSTMGVSPFIPLGSVIEQATVSAPSSGGQSAVVGTFTPFGDYEQAGTYFVEVSGTSGLGTLRLAIDGNVTTLAVPEPSTWAMFGIGFAGLALMGLTRRRGSRESARYAL
ncbi:MAG TPA: PEP-CTERM sorting domain-containing protein [Roseiarcus sp.]